MQRKIRVLVGKPGLDGHDRGAKVVAAALRDAGMEVIYTGLHQTPAQIVEAALQEDADVTALSILSGAHMTLFTEVLALMKERGLSDRLLTGGGIIPAEDMEQLAKLGVGKLFGPGSSTQDIARYIREWFIEQHGADSLAPLPVREPAAPRIPTPTGPKHRAAKAVPKRTRAAAKKAGARTTAARPKSRRAKPSRGAKQAARRR